MLGRSLRTWATLCTATVVLWGAGVSRAQANEDTNKGAIEEAKNEFSGWWDVDQLMHRAAENISRRYNLNETQRKQTHDMLTREVTKFLNEHEDIWPLVRDLARFQQSGEQPDGKIGEKLGAKVLPLLREIEDTIVEANERWRDILTEEQKRVHDYDLEDMAKTFAKMNDNFRAMAAGEPAEARLFPEPNRNTAPPIKPTKPAKDFKPEPPMSFIREVPNEHMWERYVREFRSDYQLDDAQSEAALSILKECMQRAEDYRKSKRSEYNQVEERLRDANRAELSPEARTAKTRVWVQIERALNKPIVDLFQELKDRLEPIPTEAQRAKARRAGRIAAQREPRKITRQRTTEPAKTPADSESKPESPPEENPKGAPETNDTAQPQRPSEKNPAEEKPADGGPPE